MQAKSKLKRWGNSYGIVVPKEVVEKEGLKEGELVEISARKAADVSRLFGRYSFKDLQAEKEAMRKGWDYGCQPASSARAMPFWRSRAATRVTGDTLKSMTASSRN